jgi:peptidoglycan hydrolase FlgJ
VAAVLTTEYVGGRPVARVENFRAYASYDEAFRDYGAFLKANPRYADALESTHSARAYARELQQAGYATDPRYADKLASVIDGQSLRRTVLA